VRSLPIAETARCCFICGWRVFCWRFARLEVYRERGRVATFPSRRAV
jgi:hypothetical protein